MADSLNQHLSGAMFSEGFKLTIQEDNLFESKFDYVKRELSGKNVIHVGCVDHVGLVEDKIAKNTWMHKCISNVANKCIGIDINQSGIDLLKEKFGCKNVFFHDLLGHDQLPEILSTNWDVIFLGEILEHVDDPVLFLKSIHQKYSPYIKSIVITVPNAFRSENFIGAIKNREVINSDHRYWFTPFTLSKVLVLAGFKKPELSLVSSMPITNRGPLHRFFLRKKPMFRDTLLVCASFSD